MKARDESQRPLAPKVVIENIPAELKALTQWVCWKYVFRDDKWDTPPVNATTGGYADNTAPTTWATFDAAITRYRNRVSDGIGFVFDKDDRCTGIDLDDCRTASA